MGGDEEEDYYSGDTTHGGAGRRISSFGQKCSHLAKKQRAKFYILRRCVAMLAPP
ncbi:hypothetical protein M569_15251 [Genlisea aurea]|uniref:Uncharacterized protein n=1 Tax=Genlisea aurea TaxID=192259 RepID=S8BYS5_9LAMI|nr:hypothetical protein M569_15251 [Genlisea aurea]